MFGAYGKACAATSVSFVSQTALNAGIAGSYELQRRLVAVKNCRSVTKAQMIHNNYQPVMEVDPQTYEVRADGVLLTCEPADVLPLAQRYFLF
jgi:urease subunit alpha